MAVHVKGPTWLCGLMTPEKVDSLDECEIYSICKNANTHVVEPAKSKKVKTVKAALLLR